MWRSFLVKVSCLFPELFISTTTLDFTECVCVFSISDEIDAEEGSEGGDEDEKGEGEPADGEEALMEAGDGEDDRKEPGDEFVDKEHESQFCLETNFTGKGEQEETRDEDRKGT